MTGNPEVIPESRHYFLFADHQGVIEWMVRIEMSGKPLPRHPGNGLARYPHFDSFVSLYTRPKVNFDQGLPTML